jgi:hypothetical protein
MIHGIGSGIAGGVLRKALSRVLLSNVAAEPFVKVAQTTPPPPVEQPNGS